MKVFFSWQIYLYNFYIYKLNKLKVIDNFLYSQYMTQIFFKTISKSFMRSSKMPPGRRRARRWKEAREEVPADVEAPEPAVLPPAQRRRCCHARQGRR